MWLAYAAAFSEKGGHEIDLVDSPAAGLGEEDAIERVRKCSPHLLVVETSTPSIDSDARFCGLLKKAIPNIFIVFVGTHVTALPEECLELDGAVDAVVIGEYDETIKEIADALGNGSDYTQIPGICYRGKRGATRTGSRKPLADLDSLPMVSSIYRRFLDIGRYFNPNALYPMVTITTSRGCPNHCTFCVYPQTTMGHRLFRGFPRNAGRKSCRRRQFRSRCS